MRKRRTGWRFRDGVRVVPYRLNFTDSMRFAYGVVDAMGRPVTGTPRTPPLSPLQRRMVEGIVGILSPPNMTYTFRRIGVK